MLDSSALIRPSGSIFLASHYNWLALATLDQPAQCLDGYEQNFLPVIEFGMVVAFYYWTAE